MDTSDPRALTIWVTRAISYVFYAYVLITEVILLQGFLLKLFGANPSADYTRWAYRSLERVMAPFRGIFTPIEIDGNAVLDTSILFAMVVYGIIALVLRAFLSWLTLRLDKLERQHEIERATLAASAPPVEPYPTTPASGAGSVPPAAPPPG